MEQALLERQAFGREVARIEGLPQMERWRAIKTLLLKTKPDLIPIDREFCQAIREERESNMFNKTGASKSGDMRALMSLPQYLYSVLHLIDPEFTRLQEDPETSRKTNLKLARTFPEYSLAERI
jgi:hypothetical protein